MIHRKTVEEIHVMKEGGRRLGRVLQELLEYANAGVTLLDIEKKAQDLIRGFQAQPSFSTVKGYHHATCLSVNDVVVHGVPSGYVLKKEDVLTIDVGLIYQGFHTDTAWTKIIGGGSSRFLQTGQEALLKAIDLARIGNHIGDISHAVQTTIEGAGYSLVKSLIGHGVGKELHEDPQVPNYLRGSIENTYQFQGGETIAIEPIYVEGVGAVEYANADGWSLFTKDHSMGAVFEHSVAITPEGPLVLTQWEK